MKIDLRTERRELYRATRGEVRELDVPPLRYLAVDGRGDPNTAPRYAAAVGALYAVGFATKLTHHDRTGVDYVVGPLEGLWSSADPTAFVAGRRDEWDWTMLLPLPDTVDDDDDVRTGSTRAARRRPDLPVRDVRVLDLDEGHSLQVLHVGPYLDEGPVLAALHDEVMPARGLTWNGRHHEIYLGDPRRVAPGRLRTILRQPVRPVDPGA